MKVNYIFIFLILFLSELYIIKSQKCNIYDYNLQKINNESTICEVINRNNNTYCDEKISNCVCNINFYGENCEKNITGVRMVEIGITNNSFNLLVLLFLIISPLILIIGFFIIAFIFRDQEMRLPSLSLKSKIKSNKVSISKSKNKSKGNNQEFISNQKGIDNDNDNYKQYSEVVKSSSNNDNTYNNNSNNLFNKKEKEIFDRNKHIRNEINYNDNDNENEYDNNKYSQIPLSTITDRNRKDDNILITLRNNTDNDLEDLSKSKVIGLEELNKSKNKNKIKNKNLFFDDNDNYNYNYNDEENEEKEIYYGELLLEIEEFTSEFKSSLQETFSENENFMIYIDKIFTTIENDFSRKSNTTKFLFYKSKSELQKIFNKIIKEIPNGKNYIKSNNFSLRYKNIFDIKSKDYNSDEEENLQFRNSDGDISFSKENIIDPKKIKLNVKDNSENLDISAREEKPNYNESQNNINEIKNRVMKKAFMIKSVEISRNKPETGIGTGTGLGRKERENSNEKEINFKNIDKDFDFNKKKANEKIEIRKNTKKKRKGSDDSN
jgi:hypothetical protein